MNLKKNEEKNYYLIYGLFAEYNTKWEFKVNFIIFKAFVHPTSDNIFSTITGFVINITLRVSEKHNVHTFKCSHFRYLLL